MRSDKIEEKRESGNRVRMCGLPPELMNFRCNDDVRNKPFSEWRWTDFAPMSLIRYDPSWCTCLSCLRLLGHRELILRYRTVACLPPSKAEPTKPNGGKWTNLKLLYGTLREGAIDDAVTRRTCGGFLIHKQCSAVRTDSQVVNPQVIL